MYADVPRESTFVLPPTGQIMYPAHVTLGGDGAGWKCRPGRARPGWHCHARSLMTEPGAPTPTASPTAYPTLSSP